MPFLSKRRTSINGSTGSTELNDRNSFSKARLSLDTNINRKNSSSLSLPTVQTPGWRAEYDPVVLGYRYVNDRTGQIQYDHPDEVMVSPTDAAFNHSNKPVASDHRNVFSTVLKRSLSPKFFGTNSGGDHNRNAGSSRSPSPRSCSMVDDVMVEGRSRKRSSMSLFRRDSKVKTKKGSEVSVNYSDEQDDDDVEEFKKQLEQEMLDYENQRLHKGMKN